MEGNNDVIQKTIQTSDLVNGGLLDPERSEQFLQLIRGTAILLSKVRLEKRTRTSGSIERMHIGEPITSAASENTLPLQMAAPKFDRVAYTATKTRTDWNITRETLMQNIELDNLDSSTMEAMGKRAKVDFEMLAVQGDDTGTFAAVNTPLGYLLRANSGWDIQTNDVHIVNAAGAEIAREQFSQCVRSLPDSYSMDPDVQWMISDKTLTDYVDLYGSRATAGGDAANVEGIIEQIMGRKVLAVPMIPTSQPLAVTTATSGATLGGQLGPFLITTGTNDNLLIDVDNAGGVAITLTAGLHQTVEVARQINVALGVTVAFDNGYGQLLLQSTTTTGTSEIDVQATASSAYTTLGLTIGVYIGTAAGVADTVNEGSFVWYGNPQNFIWVHVLETALFSEYNQNRDRLEMVTYAFNDYIVENKDAMVKLINVRRRQLI